MHKYAEAFEHFTPESKKSFTINLHMLCTSLNHFTRSSMTEVDSGVFVECRDAFSYLQNQGLNVSWSANYLNYIERLRAGFQIHQYFRFMQLTVVLVMLKVNY